MGTVEQSKASCRTTYERLMSSFAVLGRNQTITYAITLLAGCYERPVAAEAYVLYLEALADISEASIAEAFERAGREESRFFPPPARLRELAGAVTADQAEEQAARAALEEVVHKIRLHGSGEAMRPYVRRKPEAPKEGTWTSHPQYFTIIEPTLPPERSRRALELLGYGDRYAGLRLVAEHPTLRSDSADVEPLGLDLNAIERLEKRWIEAWQRAAA